MNDATSDPRRRAGQGGEPDTARPTVTTNEARRPGLEALITSLSTELTLLEADRLDLAVGQALQRVGEAIEVDHAWLCELSADGARMRLVHEWCTHGVSVYETLENAAVSDYPVLSSRLRSEGVVALDRADLIAEDPATHGLLGSLGLETVLAIPLNTDSSARGYLAFASQRPTAALSPDDLALLRFVGDIFADALARIEEESARPQPTATDAAASVAMLRAQRELLEKIASGTDQDAVYEGIRALAESLVREEMLAAIWTVDTSDDDEVLRFVAGGTFTDQLRNAIEDIEPGIDVGPFGRSCAGERVMIDNVMQDPTFQAYHREALAAGVRTCWTEPVLGPRGRVTGVLGLLGREACTPTPSIEEQLHDLARIAGLAFERYGQAVQSDALAAARHERPRLEALMQHARQMRSVGKTAGTVIREFNDTFTAIMGNSERLLNQLDRATGASVDGAGHETVLVCEASPTVRDVAVGVLVDNGYTVLEAADASGAIRAMEDHDGRIHLLVTDIGAPGLPARELARRIGGRWPGLRVLFTSSLTAASFDHLARGPRIADLLHKPFGAHQLVERVRVVLDRS